MAIPCFVPVIHLFDPCFVLFHKYIDIATLISKVYVSVGAEYVGLQTSCGRALHSFRGSLPPPRWVRRDNYLYGCAAHGASWRLLA